MSVFDFLRLAWVKKLPRGDSSWLNNWLNLQPIGANGKKTGKQGLSIWFGSRCLRTRVWGN